MYNCSGKTAFIEFRKSLLAKEKIFFYNALIINTAYLIIGCILPLHSLTERRRISPYHCQCMIQTVSEQKPDGSNHIKHKSDKKNLKFPVKRQVFPEH
jgi:hypothetical protein